MIAGEILAIFIRLVIPAKAGIQNRLFTGFRIKCGMTNYD